MKMNNVEDTICLAYIVLSFCEMDKDGELRPETEHSYVPDHNPIFGTVRTYSSEDEAIPRAKRVLDEAIEDCKRRGYSLRCAPKTVDDEHHNWRRIARVGKPGKPSVCLQVVITAIAPYFDPWIF